MAKTLLQGMESNSTNQTFLAEDKYKPPVIALFFSFCGIATVLCNTISFILYLCYGIKNVHGIFVMSLCIGNCFIGLSSFLATLNFLIFSIPYICSASLYTLTCGILFNLAMSCWISLERYTVVQNIKRTSDLWIEKKMHVIVFTTGLVILTYTTVLFLHVHNNDAVICAGINVFQHMFTLYIYMTSLPMIVFLIATATMYSKTLSILTKFSGDSKAQRQKHRKTTRTMESSTGSAKRKSIS